MKAKEYVAKYRDRILLTDYQPDLEKCQTEEGKQEEIDKMDSMINQAISEMLQELNREIKDIVDQRGCKKVDSLVAVVREGNDKWNAIVDRILDRDGKPVLKRDGIKNLWIKEMPSIEYFWNGKPGRPKRPY